MLFCVNGSISYKRGLPRRFAEPLPLPNELLEGALPGVCFVPNVVLDKLLCVFSTLLVFESISMESVFFTVLVDILLISLETRFFKIDEPSRSGDFVLAMITHF